ncbi:MAG: 50S ribosomal protein L10 [Candidatus Iainarchaeum archaeon]|uniref:Large ribosomal subunit protein uL10 n=1 Tax=Candidatus Iainarchaeum sp. TaxID=3101447 RepID=A0A497JI48_9ARCH|nr:MAG: 50S ribosomal protein L10 [Candidatus Diapherotrites archaeon]
MKRHTLQWKKQQLEELKSLIDKYKVIAIANIENFPASLFADIRKKLLNKAEIKVSKMRVIKKALEEKNLKELSNKVQGSVAVIFTNENPFELYSFVKKNKGNAPAKEGMIAPEDIVITARDTGLPPGPALSDLKAAGLKVKIEGQSIKITEDKVLVKKGEPVSKAAANVLAKLDIKPIKIGLNIVAAYEDGIVFTKDVLDVNAEELFQEFCDAAQKAFSLALGIYYPSKQTMPLFIAKAYSNAKSLALEANILTPETAEEIVAKALAQAKALDKILKEKG